jgi:hypothetical protein
MEQKKVEDFYIIVKQFDFKIRVSKRTYYKIFNNEIGLKTKEGYVVNLEVIRKYKKLYNIFREGIE